MAGYAHHAIPGVATVDAVRERGAKIFDIAARHGVRNVGLFGSVVGARRPLIAMYLLVDLQHGWSLGEPAPPNGRAASNIPYG
jgi:hypothetical protein